MTRLVRTLPALTLVAVLVVTASSEFRLAVDVLALPPWVAWGVPAAVDSYVVAAVRTRRDVAPAMGVMAVSLFAAAGSHIVQAHTGGQLPIQVTGPASAAMLSVLVLVAWRVHVLIDRITEDATPTIGATSFASTAPTPTELAAEEEPRTSPAPPAITSGASTPPSDASQSVPPPEAAPASAPARSSAGTSGRSGGAPAERPTPTVDLATAFDQVVADLNDRNLTVNYKNVAPALRDRGHAAGRKKVDDLIAGLDKPKLHAVGAL